MFDTLLAVTLNNDSYRYHAAVIPEGTPILYGEIVKVNPLCELRGRVNTRSHIRFIPGADGITRAYDGEPISGLETCKICAIRAKKMLAGASIHEATAFAAPKISPEVAEMVARSQDDPLELRISIDRISTNNITGVTVREVSAKAVSSPLVVVSEFCKSYRRDIEFPSALAIVSVKARTDESGETTVTTITTAKLLHPETGEFVADTRPVFGVNLNSFSHQENAPAIAMLREMAGV